MTSPAVRSALLAVSTGNPPALMELDRLAEGVKQQRLRRGFRIASGMLDEAAEGSVDLLSRCLSFLPALLDLARRAGIVEVHRV